MATYYVWDGAGSSGSPYATWNTAAADLSVIDSVVSTGDLVIVASDHQKEYSGNTTIDFAGSVELISVSRVTEDYESMEDGGGYERVTGGSITFRCFDYGNLICKGIWAEGVNTSSSVSFYAEYGEIRLVDCSVVMNENATSSYMIYLGGSGKIRCIGTRFYVPNYTSRTFAVVAPCVLEMRGCTFPRTKTNIGPFISSTGGNLITNVLLEDMDLQYWDALLGASSSGGVEMIARRCRLRSNAELFDSAGSFRAHDIVVAEYCEDGTISAIPSELYQSQQLSGTVTATTTIYRSGNDGDKNWSYEMEADASNCSRRNYLVLPHKLSKWHDATSTKTLEVFIGSNDAALTDAEVWIEVSWNDEASPAYATGEFVSSEGIYGGELIKDSSPVLKSDSSTWHGDGAPTNIYKLAISGIAPIEPGPVFVRLFFSAAGQKLWVCPKMNLI